MAKNANKAKRGPSFITALVLVVLVAVMGIELVQMSSRLRSARSEEAAIAAQVQQRRQENEALKADLSKADDLDFIKDLARRYCGMVEEGEREFRDVNAPTVND